MQGARTREITYGDRAHARETPYMIPRVSTVTLCDTELARGHILWSRACARGTYSDRAHARPITYSDHFLYEPVAAPLRWWTLSSDEG